MIDDPRTALAEAAEEVERLRRREFRSPEDALASLFETQAMVNAALAGAASRGDGRALRSLGVRDRIEQLIGRFIEVAREVAKRFDAPDFSVSVGGWPPSVTVTLSWSLADERGRA